MSLRLKIIVSLMILAGGAWTGWYFLRPVALVAPVTRGEAVSAVPGSVTVSAAYQINLKAENGGRVVKSSLEVGSPVKQGEFLAQLDVRSLQIDIDQAENQVKADKQKIAIGSTLNADYLNAKDTVANLERLNKEGTVSGADLEKQKRLLDQLKQRLSLDEDSMQQQLRTDQNSLKSKQLQLDHMTITSPIDGVITAVYAHPGDLLGGGDAIATIMSDQRTVIARISEENFAGLKVGQHAFVRFLGYGDGLYNATVRQVLPMADPQTQRYNVYLDVDIPHEKLVPGLTGEVSIVVAQHDNALIIPRVALFGRNVYVVTDGRVQLRQVKVGYVSLNEVEILSGLAEGDRVIVDQQDQFRDGNRVRTQLWRPSA